MGMRAGAVERGARLVLAALALALVAAQTDDAPERPRCAPDASDRCLEGDYALDEYFYKVNGRNYVVSFAEGFYYKIRCDGTDLEDVALPRFSRLMVFRNVTLTNCMPPATSYAAVLRALNVTVLQGLWLLRLPAEAQLTAGSFVGLGDALRELRLQASVALQPREDYLQALPGLRALTLEGVHPPARLPRRLDRLKLRRTGIHALPDAALHVQQLELTEDNVTSIVGTAARLRKLTLSAPLTALPTAPLLEEAYVERWAAAEPGPLTACSELRRLTLVLPARRLPAGLVEACASLQTLELQLRGATSLPRQLLRGAGSLRAFSVSFSNISALPDDLFHYTPQLADVKLMFLNLTALPSGVFSPLAATLRNLSLEHNQLHARDIRAAVAPLHELRRLNLAHNPLGDLCDAPAASRLSSRRTSSLALLRSLQELHLSHTGASRVCVDWVRDLHVLRRLDLTHNSVRTLACADLAVHRSVAPADLDLSHNPLDRVDCTEDDYAAAADSAIPGQRASVVLSSPLTCDCGAYWLARALRDSRVPVAFEPRCSEAASAVSGESIRAGTPLRLAPLGALTCSLRGAACADGCACEASLPLRGARVRCGRGLPLARLQHSLGWPLRELLASGAGLTRLPDALPADLQLLDLSNNSISSASAEASGALLAGGRRVRLALNPLRCACDNLPLLDALHTHRAQVEDYERLECVERDGRGRPLRPGAVLATLQCGAAAWLGVSLAGAVVVCAVAVAALLARPETRLRLKVMLHAHGVRGRWLARRLDPPDADRPYDAYVAHAEADERFVHERLAARLEPERRLCLAARDWEPGAWIPSAIERSVRAARRTLCVVSVHALEDRWTRAALRAAHAHALRDAAPRLVLLLLDAPPARLRADPDLAPLLAHHALVRWGEPCFWEKLLYALPDPRPPSVPPPAAA